MKKRIFVLLMTMVMVLGMSFASMADEVRFFEGDGYFDLQDSAGYQDVVNATFKITGDEYNIQFRGANDGLDYDIIFKYIGEEYEYTDLMLVSYNGVDYSEINYEFSLKQSGNYIRIDNKISMPELYISMHMDFYEVVSSETHQIATSITGSTASDSGNYTVTVAGYLTAELTNGTHTLSASDIVSQGIAVVVVNTMNGEMNILNQSSIDGITVTVSGGAVTQVVIDGTAHTASGSSDTYTVTINP